MRPEGARSRQQAPRYGNTPRPGYTRACPQRPGPQLLRLGLDLSSCQRPRHRLDPSRAPGSNTQHQHQAPTPAPPPSPELAEPAEPYEEGEGPARPLNSSLMAMMRWASQPLWRWTLACWYSPLCIMSRKAAAVG